MEREYWWFSDADGEFVMRRVTDDDWEACGSSLTINISELEQTAKRLGRVLTPAQGATLEASAQSRSDLGVRWLRTAQSVVNELLAHIATLEAMLARDAASRDWFMVKPEPNTDCERLSCIVCDKGHEEHLPPPEWLVTVRSDGQVHCKGLHDNCWRKTMREKPEDQ